MKQKNFPDRKNARRIIAQVEINNRLEFWKRQEKNPSGYFDDARISRGIKLAQAEFKTLSERIVDSARHIQTKKFGGKVLRQENFRR